MGTKSRRSPPKDEDQRAHGAESHGKPGTFKSTRMTFALSPEAADEIKEMAVMMDNSEAWVINKMLKYAFPKMRALAKAHQKINEMPLDGPFDDG